MYTIFRGIFYRDAKRIKKNKKSLEERLLMTDFIDCIYYHTSYIRI